jgi:hypothetical protein
MLKDWKIGDRFTVPRGDNLIVVWQVTDVGSRVLVAMEVNTVDPSWNNGPPYAVVEHVFDEDVLEDLERVAP